jgi:4-aminobutyrate aminotransferase-like enzyme
MNALADDAIPGSGRSAHRMTAAELESLRDAESKFCSFGDTVHYLPEPKVFTDCEGSFLFDHAGRSFLDLQMR